VRTVTAQLTRIDHGDAVVSVASGYVDVDARTWIDRFALVLETHTVSDDDLEALLELAGIAAHSSERMAAPISCWLAGQSGVTPAQALARARELAATLGSIPEK